MHTPEKIDNFSLTPLVRLLKNVHKFELDIDDMGEIMFNYTRIY